MCRFFTTKFQADTSKYMFQIIRFQILFSRNYNFELFLKLYEKILILSILIIEKIPRHEWCIENHQCLKSCMGSKGPNTIVSAITVSSSSITISNFPSSQHSVLKQYHVGRHLSTNTKVLHVTTSEPSRTWINSSQEDKVEAYSNIQILEFI